MYMINIGLESVTVFFVTYFALLAGFNITGSPVSVSSLVVVALSITLLRWVYLKRDTIMDLIKKFTLPPPPPAARAVESQWRASKVSTGATIPLRAERIQDKWRDYYKRDMFSGAHIETDETLHVQDYMDSDSESLGRAIPGEPISIRDRPDISNDAACAWGELETDMAPETYGGRKYAPDFHTAKQRCERDETCENVAHVRVNGDDTYTYGSGRLVERKDIKTDMISVSGHNAIKCFRKRDD